MASVDIPLSASERWDKEAARVKRGRGRWVVLDDVRGRNDKVKEALERRGLFVDVRSRNGNGSAERPWVGVRTWARTI
jgi:hypothetical protein